MSTVPNSAEQTDEPQVFRRRSTVIAGWVIAVLLVALSTLLTIDLWSHGFFPAVAGPVTGLTLGLLAVLLSVWPHVIVRDEYLEPHNSFVWYQVPYPAITDISMTGENSGTSDSLLTSTTALAPPCRTTTYLVRR